MTIKYNGEYFDVNSCESKLFKLLLQEPTTSFAQTELKDDELGYQHQIVMSFKWQEESK